jgi:hypothetical protein
MRRVFLENGHRIDVVSAAVKLKVNHLVIE